MTELAAPQISSLMEALPGIAAVLRSPVATAMVELVRAGAGLGEFRVEHAEELLRFGIRRNLIEEGEVDRLLAEVREVVPASAKRPLEKPVVTRKPSKSAKKPEVTAPASAPKAEVAKKAQPTPAPKADTARKAAPNKRAAKQAAVRKPAPKKAAAKKAPAQKAAAKKAPAKKPAAKKASAKKASAKKAPAKKAPAKKAPAKKAAPKAAAKKKAGGKATRRTR
jgi:hypothetical protein